MYMYSTVCNRKRRRHETVGAIIAYTQISKQLKLKLMREKVYVCVFETGRSQQHYYNTLQNTKHIRSFFVTQGRLERASARTFATRVYQSPSVCHQKRCYDICWWCWLWWWRFGTNSGCVPFVNRHHRARARAQWYRACVLCCVLLLDMLRELHLTQIDLKFACDFSVNKRTNLYIRKMKKKYIADQSSSHIWKFIVCLWRRRDANDANDDDDDGTFGRLMLIVLSSLATKSLINYAFSDGRSVSPFDN